MQSNRIIRPVIAIALVLMMTGILLSLGGAPASGQQPPTQGANTLLALGDASVPIHLLFKSGGKMSPAEPSVNDQEESSPCLNGFRSENKFFGYVSWVEVGEWEVILKKEIMISGQLEFNIWLRGTISSADYGFTLLVDDSPIGSRMTIQNVYINDDSDNEIKMTAQLPGNVSHLIPGQKLGIRLEVLHNSSPNLMLYNDALHRSGVIITTNGISIYDVKTCRKGITVVYQDAFSVPYSRMKSSAVLNDQVVDIEAEFNINEDNMREFVWTLTEKAPYGDNYLQVSLGYSSDPNLMWKATKNYKLARPSNNIFSWFFDKAIAPLATAWIVALLIIVFLIVGSKINSGKRVSRLAKDLDGDDYGQLPRVSKERARQILEEQKALKASQSGSSSKGKSRFPT